MKTVSILPALVLLVFIFCLHICFSLSLTVSKHLNFFLSIYEFIVVAKSSRMVVFVMFNIIIVIVFFGSFKSSSSTFKGDHCGFYNYSVPTSSVYEVDSYGYSSDDEEYQYHGYDGYDEDDENDDEDDDNDARSYVFNSDDEYGGEDKDSDQLERRIEEFIAKVNEKWREEMRYEKLMMIYS